NVNSDLKKSLEESDLIILAVPSAFLKSTLDKTSADEFKNKIVFSAIIGIVPEDLLIVGDFMQQKFSLPVANIGVITGPCHAEEVAMERLSYLTIACSNVGNAETVSYFFNCRYIKCTTS